MSSKLQQSKIQSEIRVDVACVELDDGVESIVKYFAGSPDSRSQLFKLRNYDASGAILKSFRVEGLAKDADGKELALDSSGVLVTKDSIDESTGIGTPLTDTELAAVPVTVVKDRIGSCGQTSTDEDAGQLDGDTGQIDNCYVLETHAEEYGFQAKEQCQCTPCLFRVVAMVEGGGGMFAMASVEAHFGHMVPPVTKEQVS